MSAEWCDTDPPVKVEVPGGKLLLHVIVSCETRRQASDAHKTMRASATLVNGRVTVVVDGVKYPFKLRVEVPKLGITAKTDHVWAANTAAITSFYVGGQDEER